MLFNSYSERTKCPACKTKIRLEDVKFTPTFDCPHCGAVISISTLYQRTLTWVVAIVSLIVPFLFGAKYWLIALLWVPNMAILFFLWMYMGKYWLPPKLVRSTVGDTSTLGLGPRGSQ